MTEIWKDIPGYEGYYQVSNIGNVKSLERKDKLGRKVRSKIITPIVTSKGYLEVGLYKDGNRHIFKIHRLVGLAFIPTVKDKNEINHIDENKQNNMVDNLEWCNRSENVNHGNRTTKMATTTGYAVTDGTSIYRSVQFASKECDIPRRTLRSWLERGDTNWRYVNE